MVLFSLIIYVFFIYIYQVKLEMAYIKTPPGIDCKDQQLNLAKKAVQLAAGESIYFENKYKSVWAMFKPGMSKRISRQGFLSCFCS
jgi:hypothetical protein